MGAEIKFRWGGKIPYVAENVQNVRSAVTQAVKEGADLCHPNGHWMPPWHPSKQPYCNPYPIFTSVESQ